MARRSLRIFSGDETLAPTRRPRSSECPASRRDLFKLGGAAILGTAVLAACGATSPMHRAADRRRRRERRAHPSGGVAPTPSTATEMTEPPSTDGGGNQDLVLAKTAASLEKLAVDTYGDRGRR